MGLNAWKVHDCAIYGGALLLLWVKMLDLCVRLQFGGLFGQPNCL